MSKAAAKANLNIFIKESPFPDRARKTRREIEVESTQLEFLLGKPIMQRRLDRERHQTYEKKYNKRNHDPAYFPLRFIPRFVGTAEQATQNGFEKASKHCKPFQRVFSFCFFFRVRFHRAADADICVAQDRNEKSYEGQRRIA